MLLSFLKSTNSFSFAWRIKFTLLMLAYKELLHDFLCLFIYLI